MTIIVSGGPGEATVPGVVGDKRAAAEKELEKAGFKTEVREENSDTVRAGRVISTSPPENSQLEKGRTVVLVVSSGPEQVTVPDVVGDSEADARSALENAGLQVDVAERESEDEDPGTVLGQDPSGRRQGVQGQHGDDHAGQGAAAGRGARRDRPVRAGRGRRAGRRRASRSAATRRTSTRSTRTAWWSTRTRRAASG